MIYKESMIIERIFRANFNRKDDNVNIYKKIVKLNTRVIFQRHLLQEFEGQLFCNFDTINSPGDSKENKNLLF